MKSLYTRALTGAPRFLLLCLLPVAAHAQGVAEAWVQRYNGPANDNDSASALAVDAAGNVYVTGSSGNGTYGDCDYVTIKYSSQGMPLWTNRYDGPAHLRDEPRALAVDTSSNVVVTGSSPSPDSIGQTGDYMTIKYSSTGVMLWGKRYNGIGNELDVASAVAVDAGGNVYVTGYSAGGGAGFYDYATIAYSSDGTPLWTRRYNGPGDTWDMANAIALDASGNVYVTGASDDSDWNTDLTTIKYSSQGFPLWTNRYDGPANKSDAASAIAVDATGNVYVTGGSGGDGSGSDYVTLKYSNAGVPLWTNRYNGVGNSDDEARAIAVDATGNVYVTGQATGESWGDGNYYDYVTIAYSSGGTALWTNRYQAGGASAIAGAVAVAVDTSGNVYVTGSADAGNHTYDYTTIAYSSAGFPLWTNRYNNGGAAALAVDTRGNLYVAGESGGTGSAGDFATIKYVPLGPSLSISAVGSQVRVAWPSSATGWTLRRASVLTGPYNDPGLQVSTEGNESVAYDNLGAEVEFYCLEKQP